MGVPGERKYFDTASRTFQPSVSGLSVAGQPLQEHPAEPGAHCVNKADGKLDTTARVMFSCDTFFQLLISQYQIRHPSDIINEYLLEAVRVCL
jgi:hypothetical protein